MGLWRNSYNTDRLTATLQIAQRIYSLAREHNEVAELIGAVAALAITNYYLGNLEASGQYAIRGVELWRSGGAQSTTEEVDVPGIACLCYLALLQRHSGDITSAQATIEEAISLETDLNDLHGLAVALNFAAAFACDEHNLVKAERYSSDLIELSTRHGFALWMAVGIIYRGWVRSAAGNRFEGIPYIEQGIRDVRATGTLGVSYHLALKAQALYLADRSSEALAAIKDAEALADRFEHRVYYPQLRRLRGVFLTAMGADEAQIEASFCEAIRIANEQKSVLLQNRAGTTYAEYLRQKASGSGGHGFRLPLW